VHLVELGLKTAGQSCQKCGIERPIWTESQSNECGCEAFRKTKHGLLTPSFSSVDLSSKSHQ
jgi:hypothetical protein